MADNLPAGSGVQSVAVELILAWPGHAWRKSLVLPVGATVASALKAGDVGTLFPELFQQPVSVGIFGVACSADQVLISGDRVEIYRPLHFDPKESRRRRALHKQSLKLKGGPPRRRIQVDTVA